MPTRKYEFPISIFTSILIMTFKYLPIRPFKYSFPIIFTLYKLSDIFTTIIPVNFTMTVIQPIFKITNIFSIFKSKCSFTVWNTIFENSFKIISVCKFLDSEPIWFSVQPFAIIFVFVLYYQDSFAACFAFFYFSFVVSGCVYVYQFDACLQIVCQLSVLFQYFLFFFIEIKGKLSVLFIGYIFQSIFFF